MSRSQRLCSLGAAVVVLVVLCLNDAEGGTIERVSFSLEPATGKKNINTPIRKTFFIVSSTQLPEITQFLFILESDEITKQFPTAGDLFC